MCGIFCAFSNKHDSVVWEEYNYLKENINRRGPDYHSVICNSFEKHQILLSSSVLWLQGVKLAKQPIETENGCFVYNGDIFSYNLSIYVDNLLSDTIILNHFIDKIGIYQTLTSCHGPFSVIYLDKTLKKLTFARDPFGRRSLLIGYCNDVFVISSVAKRKPNWKYLEIPPLGIFCYDFDKNVFSLTPWEQINENFESKLNELESFLNSKIVIDKPRVKQKQEFRLPIEEEIRYCSGLDSDPLKSLSFLLSSDEWSKNVAILEETLSEAVQKRVKIQPEQCTTCSFKNECSHCLTGVLFSGGLDCAILAFLCDKFSSKDRSIDLLNVAFSKTADFNTPDRLNGLSTLEELKRLCPSRKWNFIEINITESELNHKRQEKIADLIYPLNTILDDSLGCALWFASRGENSVYKSSCRVLLVGMGADELFGGYTKHRNAFKLRGWLGLFESLENDWQNLPYRNLARDDRVVSDHGRQLRTPYLDENVVNFVRNLNCWERTCPVESVPQGLGEKILLRCLAYKIGFKKAAVLKKKALQFGSRIANNKENAKDVSLRLI